MVIRVRQQILLIEFDELFSCMDFNDLHKVISFSVVNKYVLTYIILYIHYTSFTLLFIGSERLRNRMELLIDSLK